MLNYSENLKLYWKIPGHAVAQWLRHYTTSQKVVGLRPNKVNSFNLPNPSGYARPWGLLSLQQKNNVSGE
jgi:hypothetical protein